MENIEVVGLAGVPVVIGLVEVVKRGFPALPARCYPLVSLAIAVAINVAVASNQHGDLFAAAIVGLVSGLAASGLYSQAKAAIAG